MNKEEIKKFFHLKTSNICRHCCYFKNGMGYIVESIKEPEIKEYIFIEEQNETPIKFMVDTTYEDNDERIGEMSDWDNISF